MKDTVEADRLAQCLRIIGDIISFRTGCANCHPSWPYNPDCPRCGLDRIEEHWQGKIDFWVDHSEILETLQRKVEQLEYQNAQLLSLTEQYKAQEDRASYLAELIISKMERANEKR